MLDDSGSDGYVGYGYDDYGGCGDSDDSARNVNLRVGCPWG